MTTYARDALLAVAVGLRVWYLVVLFGLARAEFFGTWLHDELIVATGTNAAAVGVIVAGRMLRRDVVVWVGCVTALALQLLPGARVGLTAMQLLPWVTSTAAAVMALSATRLGRPYQVASAAYLLAGLLWLAWSVRLASLDYYIALVAMWLVIIVLAAMSSRPLQQTS